MEWYYLTCFLVVAMWMIRNAVKRRIPSERSLLVIYFSWLCLALHDVISEFLK